MLDDNFAMKTARNISTFMEQFCVPFAPVSLLTNQEYTFVAKNKKVCFFSLCGVLKDTNPSLNQSGVRLKPILGYSRSF